MNVCMDDLKEKILRTAKHLKCFDILELELLIEVSNTILTPVLQKFVNQEKLKFIDNKYI